MMKKIGEEKPDVESPDTRISEAAKGRQGSSASRLRNHYTTIQDIVADLYEQNRNRVQTYYCMNPKCPTTFWRAEEGHLCPACATLGVISEFKGGRSTPADGEPQPIIGYLDSLGRLFCPRCARFYEIEEDISLIVYADTEPFNAQPCDACHRTLKDPGCQRGT